MIKWIALVKRPRSMTLDELKSWWLSTHALTAKRLPGLRKYVVSITTSGLEEVPKYDGIAELWFDSMDDC